MDVGQQAKKSNYRNILTKAVMLDWLTLSNTSAWNYISIAVWLFQAAQASVNAWADQMPEGAQY